MKKGEIHLSTIILIVFLIVVTAAIIYAYNHQPLVKNSLGIINYEEQCSKIEVRPIACNSTAGIIVFELTKNDLSVPINTITARLKNPATDKFHLADLKYIPSVLSNETVYIENSLTQSQWDTASVSVILKKTDGTVYVCPFYEPEIPCIQ